MPSETWRDRERRGATESAGELFTASSLITSNSYVLQYLTLHQRLGCRPFFWDFVANQFLEFSKVLMAFGFLLYWIYVRLHQGFVPSLHLVTARPCSSFFILMNVLDVLHLGFALTWTCFLLGCPWSLIKVLGSSFVSHFCYLGQTSPVSFGSGSPASSGCDICGTCRFPV